MILKIEENIWQKSLILKAKTTLDRSQKIVLLLFFLIIVEIPLFLFFLKPFFSNREEFVLVVVVFLSLPLLLFGLVAFSFMPRLIYLKLDNKTSSWELGVLYKFFIKKIHLFSKEEVKRIYLSLSHKVKHNKILMELTTTEGKTLKVIFAMENSYSHEEIAKVFLNLAHLLKMKTYKAISHSMGFILNLERDYKEQVLLTSETDNFLFERPESLNKEVFKLPYISLKELTPLKVHLYKSISIYDILRYVALFVIAPIIFYIAYLSKDPQKYLAIGVSLGIYLIGLYFARNLLSPIEVIIDKLRGIVAVKKVFFTKTISLREIEGLEVKDMNIYRGPFVFHLYLHLKDNKKVHLLFLETSKESVKIQETFSHLSMLLDYLKEHFNLKVQLNLKHFER